MCNARVRVNNMISSIRMQRAHVHIRQVSNFWAINILVRVSIIQKKHCSVSFTKSIRTGRQRWLILQIDLDMNGYEVYYRRNMTSRHTRSPQTWAYCSLYSSDHYYVAFLQQSWKAVNSLLSNVTYKNQNRRVQQLHKRLETYLCLVGNLL